MCENRLRLPLGFRQIPHLFYFFSTITLKENSVSKNYTSQG